ncbi:AAA family ATPase [Clostridium sp.]|uniref:AAA family ATPase n=1 Tax=Clostridium sp. TaxID=1506 RepID=UPI0034643BB7
MKYSEALLTVKLILQSKDVPLLIGESGIGKTSLARLLSEKEGYKLITIDANLLKEGEIGGLPTVEDYETTVDNIKKKKKRTVYAVHTKLHSINEYLKNNEDGKILLFIDEINRCDHAVQQELMNLILNREINGYELNPRVLVMAAMNPSNKYDAFEDSEYEVVDMDPAQEDRFVWVEMEVDAKEWIKWGMSKKAKIHPHILEFISLFPKYLHTPHGEETVKATPRSWERISKAYNIYADNKEEYPAKIFYNVVKGNVGSAIAQDFMGFIENYKALAVTPEELFSNPIIPNDVRDNLKRESHSRLYVIAKNSLVYLNDFSHNEEHINTFSEMLKLYPVDLRIGIMREIRSDYRDSLYGEFLDCDTFIQVFFESY